ncbi:MAG: hypothetical protein WB615_07340 [Candidatus Tumulicola sp.]
MKLSEFATRAGAFALVAAIAGCANAAGVAGAGPIPSAPAPMTAKHSWMAPGAASGDLLYISDDGYGAVFVYTYSPVGMKFVGVLSQPIGPGPMCVDKQQNVWILGVRDGVSYTATEYAHGGTSPIAVLMDPAGPPSGCAIDPTTGNLALSSNPFSHSQIATIAIFHHERGKPTLYADPSIPGFYTCCAYDHRGNLFGYGGGDGSEDSIIDELPKGSNSFTHIKLNPEISFLYGIQWVGHHLTVADSNSVQGGIDEYELTPSGAKKAGSIKLSGVTLLWQYFIDGNRVIAPDAPVDAPGFVGLYHYPAGGNAIRIREFSEPVAVVVSRAPH